MKDMCFEMGTIQAFLDGELASDTLENVSRHLAMCNDCAVLLAEAEEESAFVFSALEQEFNTLVPTQRLWTKINDSIEQQRKPFWHPVFAFFKNPAMAAFASMLIVFSVFIAYLNINNDNYKSVAAVPEIKQKSLVPAVNIPSIESYDAENSSALPAKDALPQETASTARTTQRSYQIVSANVDSNNRRKNIERNSNNQSPREIVKPPQPQPAVYDYVAGQESYVKTIATLEKTVNNSKDAVLRPSERFAFEKDLAVVNDAITKMQAEVKKNPKNEAAKDVLRASYQNKIDLLSSVSEKNELMASLK